MRKLLSALLLAGAFQTAPAVLIDNFSANQGPVNGTGFVADAGILGGERCVSTSANIDFTAAAGLGGAGWNGTSSPAGISSFLFLIYDGVGGNPAVQLTLGGLDLTDGGASDRFLLDIVSSNLQGPLGVRIFVYDTFADLSFLPVDALIEVGVTGTLAIPFASFANDGTGGNFAAANSIQLLIFGFRDEESLTFDNFRTGAAPSGPGGPVIPEPSTYLLFGAGLAAVAFARRRREGSR